MHRTFGKPGSGLGHRGFLDKDVESGARHVARFQRLGQIVLVDDAAPGAVDHADPFLHSPQAVRVDDAPRLVGQGRVDRQIIALGDHGVDIAKQLDPLLAGPLGREERIVTQDAHFEPPRPLGDGLPDPAQSENRQRLPGKLRPRELAPLPFPFAHAGGGPSDIPREGHHHGDRVLGGARRIAGRRVHHDDAFARGRRQIDIVDPHAGPHDRLEPRLAL